MMNAIRANILLIFSLLVLSIALAEVVIFTADLIIFVVQPVHTYHKPPKEFKDEY